MLNVEQTIISQYANSPTLTSLVSLIDEYIDPAANIDAFYNLVWNVMAEGATLSDYGLDVWGRIVGVNRNLTLPSGLTYPGEVVNLFSSPEDFTGTGWTNNGCNITTNSAVAPDGTLTADTLTDPGGLFFNLTQYVSVLNDMAARTVSVAVKKTTGAPTFPGIELIYDNGAAIWTGITINTDTGVITTWAGATVPPAAKTVVSDGDYWRVSVSLANNNAGNTVFVASFFPAVNSDGGANWSPSTTGSVTVWGALCQTGLVASPYTPVVPGTYRLSNEDYRTLILVKALANITDSSAASLNRLLTNLFKDRGRCYVLDLGNMKMKLVFEFYLQPFEYAIVTSSGAIPHPVGVQFDIYQIDVANTFGFNEAVNLQPFNQGTFYPG